MKRFISVLFRTLNPNWKKKCKTFSEVFLCLSDLSGLPLPYPSNSGTASFPRLVTLSCQYQSDEGMLTLWVGVVDTESHWTFEWGTPSFVEWEVASASRLSREGEG